MRLFILTLILAVLAVAAIRVWFINMDEEAQRAEIAVVTVGDGLTLDEPLTGMQSSDAGSDISLTASRSFESGDDVPTIFREDFTEPGDLLRVMEFDPEKFWAAANAWYAERGMHTSMTNTAGPDQPYQQYDDQTLLGLAGSGDMWAQQILGDRWINNRPAEAVELFQRAAEQGSVQAMARLSRLYDSLASLNDPIQLFDSAGVDQAQLILDATPDLQLESARWLGAAEIMSGGMWIGPDQGEFLGSTPESVRTSADRQDEICERSLQTYQDLRDARIAAGGAPIPITAPPWIDHSHSPGYCDSPDWPRPDISDCRQIRFARVGEDATRLFSFCMSGDR